MRDAPERIPPERGEAGPTRPLRPGDHVVIVGAGPAGLTAAHELTARDDVAVTVLEATGEVGGISRTAEYRGYRFDIGGHRFFTKLDVVQEMWEEVLGDEFLTVPRLSRIYYDGDFFRYPLEARDALRGLGVWESLLIVGSYLKWHLFPYPEEESFEQWVTNRFGKRLYETFFKTYTEKVWGVSCTEIRAEWAAQRIKGFSLAEALLSAASLGDRGDDIETLIDRFRYPRLGPGQMWERTRDRVRERGARVLTEHRVTAIEHRDEEAVAVVAETPEGSERFEADHVISSMPVRSLVRALDRAPPAEIVEAAEGLRYRDFLVVALILEGEDLLPDNWIYIHDPDVRVGRIQNFKNWSEDMVPDDGRTCLGMEYFCFEGDGLWSADDEELVALASRELERLGVAEGAGRPDGSGVVDGTVVRMPKAYPIYDRAYRGHLETVRGCLDRVANLHPVGRNGMHKYNNQDHSMLTAMMSVWNMEGASYDVWAVNTGFEYLEEQKLERPDRSLRPSFVSAGFEAGSEAGSEAESAAGDGPSDRAEPDLVQAAG